MTTDGTGTVSFTATSPTGVPLSHFITTTVTDFNNNTSEFSRCVQVSVAPMLSGDTNEDDKVDALDVTEVERIIAGLD